MEDRISAGSLVRISGILPQTNMEAVGGYLLNHVFENSGFGLKRFLGQKFFDKVDKLEKTSDSHYKITCGKHQYMLEVLLQPE